MRQCGNIPNWDSDSCLFTAVCLLEFASSDSRGCYLLNVPSFMFTYLDAARSFSSTWYLKMKHQQTIVHQQSSATFTCNLEGATCIPKEKAWFLKKEHLPICGFNTKRLCRFIRSYSSRRFVRRAAASTGAEVARRRQRPVDLAGAVHNKTPRTKRSRSPFF